MTVATFGEKQEDVQYVNRYGVYAVIPDEKQEKIILVQARRLVLARRRD